MGATVLVHAQGAARDHGSIAGDQGGPATAARGPKQVLTRVGRRGGSQDGPEESQSCERESSGCFLRKPCAATGEEDPRGGPGGHLNGEERNRRGGQEVRHIVGHQGRQGATRRRATPRAVGTALA